MNNEVKSFEPTAPINNELSDIDIKTAVTSFKEVIAEALDIGDGTDFLYNMVEVYSEETLYYMVHMMEKLTGYKVIGNGAGRFAVLDKSNQLVFKVIYSGEEGTTQAQHEAQVIDGLKKQGHLRYLPRFYEDFDYLVVMEYIPYTITEYYSKEDAEQIVEEVKTYFEELGIADLVGDLTHYDNIRVRENGEVVVVDFGNLCFEEEDNTSAQPAMNAISLEDFIKDHPPLLNEQPSADSLLQYYKEALDNVLFGSSLEALKSLNAEIYEERNVMYIGKILSSLLGLGYLDCGTSRVALLDIHHNAVLKINLADNGECITQAENEKQIIGDMTSRGLTKYLPTWYANNGMMSVMEYFPEEAEVSEEGNLTKLQQDVIDYFTEAGYDAIHSDIYMPSNLRTRGDGKFVVTDLGLLYKKNPSQNQ